jgi:ComF family protein
MFQLDMRVATNDGFANHSLMLLRSLENALIPLRCVFCGTRTHEPEDYICTGCNGDLPRLQSPPPAETSPLRYEIAVLAYVFPVDAAIKAFKFQRRLFYAPAFAQLLCAASDALPDDVDAVLPVPLHWRRKWFRGFNQALEIGKPVARHLGVPVIQSIARRRATAFQSGLSARERASNLRSAFVLRTPPACRHVLVVDDVITTGTTVRQIARVLKRAGVARVSALAVARA